MSFSSTLFPMSPMAVPFSHVLLLLVQLTLMGGVLMFFRPLLTGIVRALVLVVRPRPTKDELAARRKLRDAQRALQPVQAGTAAIQAIGSRSCS